MVVHREASTANNGSSKALASIKLPLTRSQGQLQRALASKQLVAEVALMLLRLVVDAIVRLLGARGICVRPGDPSISGSFLTG
jgi:hypothetical protein